MELNQEEKTLIEQLAELLSRANAAVDKVQITRSLSIYAEGLKTGVAIKIDPPAQMTAV